METFLTIANRILNPRADLSSLKRDKDSPPAPTAARNRVQPRHIVSNFPLMLGGLIVLGLFFIVLFGPLFAPENPYLAGQRTITYENGVLSAPPYPPSEEFPLGTDQWGRDILSMLLYGARNTLVACAFIAMARLILGVLLGAAAGWNEGKWIDRAVMGSIGMVTALPILLSSMILILALDIRRGLPVFIVALSIVGWAEIAQYIRSEFIVLRQKPFIEGARATGLPGLAIAVRHVFPNILPYLMVITLLEMGVVLMLMGELAFIGIFIGGGTQTEGGGGGRLTIPDIPEWGAMMADSRVWARAKPWMVFYPAAAFFVAVVGFNMFGEGLRRLVERAGLNTGFLLKRRMILVIVAITLGTIYTINNVGPAPSYAKLAGQFNGEVAYGHVQTLTDFEGRGNGQPGNEAAVAYLVDRFEAYGLQPAGRGGTYIHSFESYLVHPLEQPALSLHLPSGEAQSFSHQLDFGFVTEGHGGSGQATAPLTFIGFRAGANNLSWDAYRGLDLRGQIVLLLAENAPPNFAAEALIRGAEGVLWVTDEGPESVRSQIQLGRDTANYLRQPQMPIFRIRPSVAEAMLAPDGLSLSALRDEVIAWPEELKTPWLAKTLSASASMAVNLSEPEEVELVNVLGYIPGQDIALDDQLVVVSSHYDGLGLDPDGSVYPSANDNASGVAVLLETIRLWQERGLTPRRTVLFSAWGAGELDHSGADEYFNTYGGSLSLLNTVAIFQLDNLGAGGDEIRINASSARLANLVESSASDVGLSVVEEEGNYHAYQDVAAREAPSVLISWTDSQAIPSHDTLERIDPEKLRSAGEAIILTLTNATRLPRY